MITFTFASETQVTVRFYCLLSLHVLPLPITKAFLVETHNDIKMDLAPAWMNEADKKRSDIGVVDQD